MAKLDAAFAAIERAETAARRAQKRIVRYRTAILDAAVSGELSRTWRENYPSEDDAPNLASALAERILLARRSRWEENELSRLNASGKPPKGDKWKSRYREPVEPRTESLPVLPKQWIWISASQLSWDAGYGTSIRCAYDGKGPAVLRIPNVRGRRFNLEDLKFATTEGTFKDEDFLMPGDLLLIRTNGSKDIVGRAAILQSPLPQKCSFASYLIRFRLLGDKTLWSWVSLVWDSNLLRSAIESRAATTAGQYNISLSGLTDIAIPLPSSEEQAETIAESERRMSAADRLETALQQQLSRALTARQTLLRDAFDGELVSQDPRDEAGSSLLQRIKATRTIIMQSQKGKRMPQSKSKAIQRSLLDVLREHAKPITPEQLFRDSGYQQEFKDSECRQEIVDRFYEELRRIQASTARLSKNASDAIRSCWRLSHETRLLMGRRFQESPRLQGRLR